MNAIGTLVKSANAWQADTCMEHLFGVVGVPGAERGIDSFDNLFAETERSSAAPRGAPVEREDAMTHQQGDFIAVVADIKSVAAS